MSERRPARTNILVVAAASVAGLLLGVRPGVASCAGPTVVVHQSASTRTITVVGSGWLSGCNDTGTGCSKTGPVDPIADVRLFILRRSGPRMPIGSASPDRGGAFSLAISVPKLPRGRYRLFAEAPGGYPRAAASFVYRPPGSNSA